MRLRLGSKGPSIRTPASRDCCEANLDALSGIGSLLAGESSVVSVLARMSDNETAWASYQSRRRHANCPVGMSAYVATAKTPTRKAINDESSPEPGMDADENAKRAKVVIPAAISAIG